MLFLLGVVKVVFWMGVLLVICVFGLGDLRLVDCGVWLNCFMGVWFLEVFWLFMLLFYGIVLLEDVGLWDLFVIERCVFKVVLFWFEDGGLLVCCVNLVFLVVMVVVVLGNMVLIVEGFKLDWCLIEEIVEFWERVGFVELIFSLFIVLLSLFDIGFGCDVISMIYWWNGCCCNFIFIEVGRG